MCRSLRFAIANKRFFERPGPLLKMHPSRGKGSGKAVVDKVELCLEAVKLLIRCQEKLDLHLEIHLGRQMAQVQKSSVDSRGLDSCPSSVLRSLPLEHGPGSTA